MRTSILRFAERSASSARVSASLPSPRGPRAAGLVSGCAALRTNASVSRTDNPRSTTCRARTDGLEVVISARAWPADIVPFLTRPCTSWGKASNLKNLGVIKITHNHGQFVQFGDLRRAPAAFARNDFIAIRVRNRAHDKRLDHTFLPQRISQILQRLGLEIAARLVGVWHDLFDRHHQIRPTRRLGRAAADWIKVNIRHKSGKTPPKTATFDFLFHQAPSSSAVKCRGWRASNSMASAR